MSAPGKRPAQSTAKCRSYRSSGQRDKNRDRRVARILRRLSGLRGGKRRSREYEERQRFTFRGASS